MFVFFLAFIFLTHFSPIIAVDEFSVKHQINYTINQSGIGEVTHQIDITNNFAQLFPTEYQLSIAGISPQNIQTNDEFGSIVHQITTDSANTQIQLKLPHAKAGKNQVTSFSVRYHLPHLAVSKGKTWEITLPQFYSNLPGSFVVNLKVPTSFGRLSFSPSHTSIQTDTLYSLVKINQFDPQQKNIFVFGNLQLFDFHLQYHLQNQDQTPALIPIALPPDTAYQKIIFTDIIPPPQNVATDSDGNWLAYFSVPGLSAIDITVSGQAKISHRSIISPAPLANLLNEQLYWPVSHPDIQSLAARYSTPKSIYDYVITALTYDDNRLDTAIRRGALVTLQQPANSICTDFTDLFITVARAAGIPAREIEGFAYSNNLKIKPLEPGTDLLHAWPEYYDSTTQSWIAIDPTWAKTTNGIDYFHDLDLNHLAFVIHGTSSDYPPPPGSYKIDPQQKTVEVTFADAEVTTTPLPPTLSLKVHPFSTSQLIVTNSNLQALDQIHISSALLQLDTTIPSLAPLSQKVINLPQLPIVKSVLPQNQKINFSVIYSPDYRHTITITNPLHYLSLSGLIIVGLTILSLGGIILTKRNP